MPDKSGKKPVPFDPCRKPGPVAIASGEGGPPEPPRSRIMGGFEFPRILRNIGPKHIAIARLFSPTMAYYTAAGVLLTIYFCDWKAVLQYVPFWNGKYKKEFDEKAAYEAAMAKKKHEENQVVIPEVVQEKDPKCP